MHSSALCVEYVFVVSVASINLVGSVYLPIFFSVSLVMVNLYMHFRRFFAFILFEYVMCRYSMLSKIISALLLAQFLVVVVTLL